MSEIDRLIGRFEEFMEGTKTDLSEIKKALEDLKAFKWKVLGGATAISVIASLLMRFL